MLNKTFLKEVWAHQYSCDIHVISPNHWPPNIRLNYQGGTCNINLNIKIFQWFLHLGIFLYSILSNPTSHYWPVSSSASRYCANTSQMTQIWGPTLPSMSTAGAFKPDKQHHMINTALTQPNYWGEFRKYIHINFL